MWALVYLYAVYVGLMLGGRTESTDCSQVECEPVLNPKCPPDSVLIQGQRTHDGCCHLPGNCECSSSRCRQPVCHVGYERVLKERATGTPGHCCDEFRCKLVNEKDCSKMKCPLDVAECPPDSYRLPSLLSPDGCCSIPQGCVCLPGPCPPVECPPGKVTRVVRQSNSEPGSCCTVFECVEDHGLTCQYDGKEYRSGERWMMDKCTHCRCDTDGLTFCKTIDCAPVPNCEITATPEGECCPVCIGCLSRTAHVYNNSATWQEDVCTTCRCENGQSQCQAYMCKVKCQNARKVPGECCPVCDGPTEVTPAPQCSTLNCTLRCINGLEQDSAGCFQCRCKTVENCGLNCVHGYMEGSEGHLACQCKPKLADSRCPDMTSCFKNCAHGYRSNKDGCEICKCNKCRKLKNCPKKCPYGFLTNNHGCPICKCRDGPTYSSVELEQSRTHISYDLGLLCHTSEGTQYDDGETWFDGCRQCYCHGGLEMCTLITCPVPKCEHPMIFPGDCCPKCLGDIPIQVFSTNISVCHAVDGRYRVETETWSLDPCTDCICHQGHVMCESKKCPPVPCLNSHVLHEECCPICPNFKMKETSESHKMSCPSDDGEREYSDGDMWRVGACQSCSCENGKISCFSERCPTVTCKRPILRKNQCCPICMNNQIPRTCHYDNITYDSGETWMTDLCTHCVCQDGNTVCTEKVCSISCSNPIKIPGQCCPVCKESIPQNDVTGSNGHSKSTARTKFFHDKTADRDEIIVSEKEGSVHHDEDSVLFHQPTEPSQLSITAVVICVIIFIFLFCTIAFLLHQRWKLKNQNQKLKTILCNVTSRPRPKSTNLEYQGAIIPCNSDPKSNCNLISYEQKRFDEIKRPITGICTTNNVNCFEKTYPQV